MNKSKKVIMEQPRKEYKVQMIPVEDCHTPEWNPGARNEDTSLAASITETNGVESPILVRVRDAGGFEIVAGNRRHAGTVAAGFITIAAFVREFTETQARVHCGIENLQRLDLGPLEEADWYAMMLATEGETVETLAGYFGRSEKFITDRAHLAGNLSHNWRKAMAAKKGHIREWRFSHLLHIAKLARNSQDDFLKEARAWQSVPTEAHLIGCLQMRTQLLSAAPWSLSDAHLVKRKPCTGCATRSEAQALLLFEDLPEVKPGKDRCLDTACWLRKTEAWLAVRVDELHSDHGEDLLLWFDGHGEVGEEFQGVIHGEVGEEFQGVPVIRSWDHRWTRVAKSRKDESGARPGLVIAGPDLGQLIWLMDPSAAARQKTGKPSGQKEKKTLKERRAQLDGIRSRIAAEKLQAVLGGTSWSGEEGQVDQMLNDPRMALALAVIFGTRFYYGGTSSYFSMHGDPIAADLLGAEEWEGATRWDLLDKLLLLDESEILAHLWRAVRPVMAERLNDVAPKRRQVLRLEVERQAPLVALDASNFWTHACEQKKTPKSWAKEVTRGESS